MTTPTKPPKKVAGATQPQTQPETRSFDRHPDDRHPDDCRCESCQSVNGDWHGIIHDPEGDWDATWHAS